MLENNTETTETTSTESSTETTAPTWYYSAPGEDYEGVAGIGETPPDWMMVDKYKSVEEQAKGYNELSKRFGGFVGSPEQYEIPEIVNEVGMDEGVLNILQDIGKESQMSQGMFNNILTRVGEYRQQEAEQSTKAQMEALGENAEQRIQNVNNWLNTNAPKEIIEKVAPLGTSAEAIEAIEWFMDKAKGTTVANNNVEQTPAMSDAEFAEMLMAKDNFGNLKVSTDPQYKKKMDDITAKRMK